MKDFHLKLELTPDLGHGPQGEFAWIFEFVLFDKVNIITNSHLFFGHLAFEDLKRFGIPALPPHENVQHLVGVVIYFLKLINSVQIFVDNPVGIFEGNIFYHI